MRFAAGFSFKIIVALLGFLVLGPNLYAQDERQQNLENQRKRLQQEIKQINKQRIDYGLRTFSFICCDLWIYSKLVCFKHIEIGKN